MELRVLRYFQAVVQERNISRAAVRLHVSQPTISRQLHDLEEELGIVLFERGSRNIQLTDGGQYFFNQANQILALTDKTLANIHEEQSISGNIVIGSAETRSFLNIAQSINGLRQQYPKIRVDIISTNADQIRVSIKSGYYDFGIVVEPSDKTGYDFMRLPGESRWGLLVSNHSPLAAEDHLELNDLLDEDLIVSSQHGMQNLLDEWFGGSTQQLKIVATYTLLYNASLMVSAGIGSALCINGIINTNQSDLVFVPFAPRLTAGTSLVWRHGQRHSAAAEAFLKRLSADIGQSLPTKGFS